MRLTHIPKYDTMLFGDVPNGNFFIIFSFIFVISAQIWKDKEIAEY